MRPVQQPIDVKISTRTPTQIQESKKNLMNTPWIARTMRSPLFPGIFQSILAAGFVLIAFELLVGPSDAHSNFGTALMWVLWWPLIPIVFVLLGRFWCAICPFATLNDFVQKFTGGQMAPPAFLKNYGIWIIDGLFILITWADHVFGIVKSPLGSGVLLLLLTTSVIASGAFFQRRTFCRSLCPIGGLSGNYARTGIVTLRANTDICLTCKAKAVCFNGGEKAPECPLWQFPRTMESGAECTLCAHCIKNCPNDAISLQVGLPTRELWTIRKPKLAESFLAMAIMGIVLVQNLTMLDIWQKGLDAIENLTGINNWTFLFTTVFIVAVGFPVLTLIYAAKFTANRFGDDWRKWFAIFGYAMIPLDIAGHVAHNLFHLLGEGKAVWFTAMPFFGQVADASASPALVATPIIQVLQYAIVALGAIASLYAVYRIAKFNALKINRSWKLLAAPFLVTITMFMVINIGAFSLPMMSRM